MKTIVRPTCASCGYTYDPKQGIRVLIFQNNDDNYTACERCIEELGRMMGSGTEDEEVNAFIDTFKN